MQTDFETLISEFIENKVGICQHFIKDDLATHLKINLLAVHQQKLLLAAGTGNTEKLFDKSIRSDAIFWLDRKNNDRYENQFFDLMDDFIRYLNSSCFAGITDYEFHYSMYEIGSFYKKHFDQFQNDSNRKYSMISYLNNNWVAADGGELLIHQSSGNQQISPTQGKTIFFNSNEIEHEVLVTHQQRMSITGWLKNN